MMVSSSLVSRSMSRRSSLILATSIVAVMLFLGGLVLRDFRHKMSELDVANRDYRSLSEAQRTRIHELQSELSEERRARRSESEQCSKESSELRSETSHLEEQVKELQQALADFKETSDQMEEESHLQQEQMQKELRALRKERDGKRSQYDSILSQNQALAERLEHLEKALEESEQERARLRAHVDHQGVSNKGFQTKHVLMPASSSSPNTSKQVLLQPRVGSSTSKAPSVLQNPSRNNIDELEAPLEQQLHDAVVQPALLQPRVQGQQHLLRRPRVLQRNGREADEIVMLEEEDQDEDGLSALSIMPRRNGLVQVDEDDDGGHYDDNDGDNVLLQSYESNQNFVNSNSVQRAKRLPLLSPQLHVL